MYLNRKAFINIEEALKYDVKSNIVKSWAKKYKIDEDTLATIWRRSELVAAKNKGCKCIPWGTVTDIFKLTVRKYFKLNKDDRKDIKDPKIDNKKLKDHKDEESGGAVDNKYKIEIKKLQKECPNFDKLPSCTDNNDYYK